MSNYLYWVGKPDLNYDTRLSLYWLVMFDLEAHHPETGDVTAAFPRSDFFPFMFLITFLCFACTFFLLFSHSFQSRRFVFSSIFRINSAFNFIHKSFLKKLNIGVSECIRLTLFLHYNHLLVFPSFVLASHTTFVSVFPCPIVSPLLFCIFLFLLLHNSL